MELSPFSAMSVTTYQRLYLSQKKLKKLVKICLTNGSVKTSADLYVGERARIHANVAATNAKVSGEIRGNVKIKAKLELTPTSRIFGDVHTKILTVEAGAQINGKVVMGAEEEAASAKATERTEKTVEGLSVLLGGRSRSDKERIKL